jgi:2'-5' RNA ligase
MRLFVGIPLSSEVRADLTSALTPAVAQIDGWRWVSAESWHITLQFLGNTIPEKCEFLSVQLRDLRSPAVPIQLDRLDFFEHAGIFYAGISLCPELFALQQKVSDAATQSGFSPETRPYRPHITLARAKNRVRGRTLRAFRDMLPKDPELSPFLAEEILLFESFLGPSGARHEIRERFELTRT